MTTKTAALGIPILPHTSPEAQQPEGIRLPLHDHQLRALHRCLLIESDGTLSGDFGQEGKYYKSRGGVLADAVGTGKTATSIGLVLSDVGDTLVVAPAHLIPQWRHEITKFAGPDHVQVLVGKREYERKATLPPPPNVRRIVLVDVDTVLNEEKLWYKFRRRVFHSEKGGQLSVSSSKMEEYRKAALFCVQSPRGPCSYDGWVYTGSLHFPFRPWRRVIMDEIQDLVAEGTESQKNLMQLSRTARNVWLLSATPFPHGNQSVYANHELLGFCRLRMNVEVDRPLSRNHTFEVIKRKLYIRSPPHVAEKAVAATVVRQTKRIQPMAVETKFYQLEMGSILNESSTLSPRDNKFSDMYISLRQMMVHPEASETLRLQIFGNRDEGRAAARVGQFSSLDSFARTSLQKAKTRLFEIEKRELPSAKEQLTGSKRSLMLAIKIKTHRAGPVTSNPFAAAGGDDVGERAGLPDEAAAIHSFYCSCPYLGGNGCSADSIVYFRTIQNDDFAGPQYIRGSTKRVVDYFEVHCHPNKRVGCGTGTVPALDHYISVSQRAIENQEKAIETLKKERKSLKTRVNTLSANASNAAAHQDDVLAKTHGSKPAALVHYLREAQEKGESCIVFSYHHDTLRLVRRTLSKCGLQSCFCDGSSHAMSKALADFTSGAVSILLLSAQAKASGANLQCATHVVLLDPAGSSAEHGAALEQQAIGRAVRMGQEKPVTVTRFCVQGTIEETLFEEIDDAAAKAATRASDSSYVCESAHKAMPKKVTSVAKEDDDVLVTASVSATERVKRQFEHAQEKGMVIEMLDSDDENEPPTYKTMSVASAPPDVVVKTELDSTVNERVSLSQDDSPSTSKRAASNVDNGQEIAGRFGDLPAKRPRPEATGTFPNIPSSVGEHFSTPANGTRSRTHSSVATTSTPELEPSLTPTSESSEASSSDEPSMNGMHGVGQLLDRCMLSEYRGIFQEKGYDSLEWLYECADNVEIMEKVATSVEFKPGHAIRFQYALSKEAKESNATKARPSFIDV